MTVRGQGPCPNCGGTREYRPTPDRIIKCPDCQGKRPMTAPAKRKPKPVKAVDEGYSPEDLARIKASFKDRRQESIVIRGRSS